MIQIEFQVRDRLSFMRFLQFSVGDIVPDAKTIRLFREQITEAGLVTKLFKQFDKFLSENGFAAKKGQIVDACIAAARKHTKRRHENKAIKNGNRGMWRNGL
jgi:IS5 family transposase